MTNPPALEVSHLVRSFRRPDHRVVTPVDDVSFSVAHDETLGLVGESGCGKSTLARALMQLPPPSSGTVKISGEEMSDQSAASRRQLRRKLQMVFQDTVWSRRPHEMSGGQCQRVAIARALMLEPTVLVLDEPVSALDVSVQAQILNLLLDIKSRRSFSMIFISHDLAVIRNICDRVAVMYLGRIVEIGKTEDVYRNPQHPYTKALLGSVLAPGQKLPDEEVLSGDLPSLINPPSGCRFRTRCTRATERCAVEQPQLDPSEPDHFTACHHPLGFAQAELRQSM
jgi:peptide/nickel transport system ATP-binding protein